MSRFKRFTSSLAICLAFGSAIAAPITGTWTGRIIVDRGSLPRHSHQIEQIQPQMDKWKAVRLGLKLDPGMTFTLKANNLVESVQNIIVMGTYTRSGNSVILHETSLNGNPINPPTDETITLSGHDHVMKMQFLAAAMWFQFNKD